MLTRSLALAVQKALINYGLCLFGKIRCALLDVSLLCQIVYLQKRRCNLKSVARIVIHACAAAHQKLTHAQGKIKV